MHHKQNWLETPCTKQNAKNTKSATNCQNQLWKANVKLSATGSDRNPKMHDLASRNRALNTMRIVFVAWIHEICCVPHTNKTEARDHIEKTLTLCAPLLTIARIEKHIKINNTWVEEKDGNSRTWTWATEQPHKKRQSNFFSEGFCEHEREQLRQRSEKRESD